MSEFLKLRELMADKGITGKSLAAKVGISIPAMSAIVTGKSQPRFELMAKIAKELDAEVPDLFHNSREGKTLYVKEGGQFKAVGRLD